MVELDQRAGGIKQHLDCAGRSSLTVWCTTTIRRNCSLGRSDRLSAGRRTLHFCLSDLPTGRIVPTIPLIGLRLLGWNGRDGRDGGA